MVKYKVNLINPGKARGRQYTKKVLQKAQANTLGGCSVYHKQRGKDKVVGEVIDNKYDNGVYCTVKISNEETIKLLDNNSAKIAPVLLLPGSNNVNLKFRRLAIAPNTHDLVGETKRIKMKDLYW